MKRLLYYLKIWLLMSRNSFLIMLSQKLLFLLFLTGKLLRFVFFVAFLYFLVIGSKGLAGYSVNQVIFFFLTFNMVDILAQFLFREVYRFRPLIISGDFDLVLVKPMNALFRVLMGGADIIDLVTVPPLLAATVYVGSLLNPTLGNIVLYVLLIFNALIIATAFHIAALSLGIITLEIDNTIMMYRDIVNLGKFPIDIYRQPLRAVLTYLIPVGVMVSLPAKSLMGLASFWGVVISFVLGIVLFFTATKFWHYALRFYTSASN